MVGLPIAVIVAIPSCFAAYWMCVFVLRIFSPAFRRSRKISIQRIPFEAARAAFEAYLKEKDREMRSFWMCLDGHSFENEAASLFRKLGYQAEVTTMSGDQGIDIALTGQDDELVVVQCKQHKKPVGPTTGFYRVRRGGSWYSAWTFRQSDLRSAGRAYLKYSHSNFGLGFRLARTAQ